MTLQERLTAAKRTADDLIKQQQNIQQAAQQNQVELIRVDTEISLLEQLITDAQRPALVPVVKRGRKPRLAAVS